MAYDAQEIAQLMDDITSRKAGGIHHLNKYSLATLRPARKTQETLRVFATAPWNNLVGAFNHLEKYEFVNRKDENYPIYEMENKSHVPVTTNQQSIDLRTLDTLDVPDNSALWTLGQTLPANECPEKPKKKPTI